MRPERTASEPRPNPDPLCEVYPRSPPTHSSAENVDGEHVMGTEKGTATAHNLEIPMDDTQIVHVVQAARDPRNLASKRSKRSRVQ
jgi:hypothetical protein